MKTILLVEDDKSIRQMLVELFSSETCYRTQVACDAAEAIELAASGPFDLLITNYRLPGTMDGVRLYDYVHQMPGWEHVPAILISATLPEEALAVRNIIGIYKPFEVDHLLEQIDTLLASELAEGTDHASS